MRLQFQLPKSLFLKLHFVSISAGGFLDFCSFSWVYSEVLILYDAGRGDRVPRVHHLQCGGGGGQADCGMLPTAAVRIHTGEPQVGEGQGHGGVQGHGGDGNRG